MNSSETKDVILMNKGAQSFTLKDLIALRYKFLFQMILLITAYIDSVIAYINFSFACAVPVEKIPIHFDSFMVVVYCFDLLHVADLLLAITFYKTMPPELHQVYLPPSTLSIFFKICALTPLDGIYWVFYKVNMRVLYGLRLRYYVLLLTCYEEICNILHIYSFGQYFFRWLLKFCLWAFFASIFYNSFLYVFYCTYNTENFVCRFRDYDHFRLLFKNVLGVYLRRGFPNPVDLFPNSELFFIIVSIDSIVFLASTFTGSLFLITFITSNRGYIYRNITQKLLRKLLGSLESKNIIIVTIKKLIGIYWDKRNGIELVRKSIEILPEGMIRDVNLDVFWFAFKHSHIFRIQQVHFLRYIANLMEATYFVPGEVVFRRHCFKNRMVYLVSGVIQILSEEDGETAFLSFSGGTLLGELTLMEDSPSSYNVVCKTYCVVHILQRKKFLRAFKKYPEQFREISQAVRMRYQNARNFRKVLALQENEMGTEETAFLTLKYFRTTLERLMEGKDLEDLPEEKTYSFEEMQLKQKLKTSTFCAKYLDHYVLSQGTDLNEDVSFIKPCCPCIFETGSTFLYLWGKVCAFVALGFAFAFPYFAVFYPQDVGGYIFCVYVVTTLWMLDLYIISSTTVRLPSKTLTQVRDIVWYNIFSVSYWLEIIAAVPMELTLIMFSNKLDLQTFMLFQSNRLLKVRNIRTLFSKDFKELLLKFIIYVVLLCYYSASIIYLFTCFNTICDVKITFSRTFIVVDGPDLLEAIYYGHQVATGLIFARIFHYGGALFLFLTILCVFSAVFYMLHLCDFVCCLFFSYQDYFMIQDRIADIEGMMTELKLNKKLKSDAISFYATQWKFDRANEHFHGREIIHGIPTELYKAIKKETLFETIKSVPVLKEMPDAFLIELLYHTYTSVLPPKQIVVHRGEVSKEMYILVRGYCSVNDGNVSRIITGLDSFAVLECYFQYPVINTVQTLTHATLLCCSKTNFQITLFKFPHLMSWLRNLKQEVNAHHYLKVDVKSTTALKQQAVEEEEHDDKSSFVYFKYKLKENSKDWHRYYGPFRRNKYLNFLRFFLLRITFRTKGRFLFWWELFRAIFAYLTVLLSPIPMIGACDKCLGWYVLLILDITAWIDIYFRHHVTFYNAVGIEATHPLTTASHFWTHAFCLDLIASFPFNFVVPLKKYKIILRANRLLQLYRPCLQFVRFDTYHTKASKRFIIKFIPYMILYVNLLGSFLIHIVCEFDPSIRTTAKFTAGVSCKPNSWVTISDYAKPISPWRAYLYGVYQATVTFTTIGTREFELTTHAIIAALWILTVIAFIFWVCFNARFIATYLYRNSALTVYQTKMKALITFMNYGKVDPNLKDEVINHFELIWLKKKGRDLHDITRDFQYALRDDILYDAYGKVLSESHIFRKANPSFFRSLLLKAKHEIYINTGIISRVNDIHGWIYIAIKGNVDVLGPDYNRLFVLPLGSMFGNLDDCERSRMTLTMVAKGHVEVLAISSVEFYKILSSYRKLYADFLRQTAFHVDYLLGGSVPPDDNVNEDEAALEKGVNIFHKWKYILFSVKDHTSALRSWKIFIVIITVGITLPLESYHLTIHQHTILLLLVLYFADIVFVIDIYFKFLTTYEDEYGILVRDKRKIIMSYLKNPLGFPLDLFSVFPFELICLFFIRHKFMWYIWSICRVNRLLKVYLAIDYLYKKRRQLNINVLFVNLVYSIVSLTCFILFSMIIISNVGCLFPGNNIVFVSFLRNENTFDFSCNWESLSEMDKFKAFLQLLFYVSFTVSGIGVANASPNHEVIIILVIGLMIASKLVLTLYFTAALSNVFVVSHNLIEYIKNLQILFVHMERENVSRAIMNQVKSYGWLLWTNHEGNQMPSLIEQTPYYLKEAIMDSLFGFHLKNHPLLGRFHLDLIRQMTSNLLLRVYFPGDYITFINDIDESMYFIHEGVVEVISKDTLVFVRIHAELKEGDMFGLEQGLNPELGQAYTYRAKFYSIVLTLKHRSWYRLLQFFPASEEIMRGYGVK